jgi:hypothetical protein
MPVVDQVVTGASLAKTAPAYSKGAFAKYLPLRKTAKDQDSIINCRSFSDARPRSKKLLQHQ